LLCFWMSLFNFMNRAWPLMREEGWSRDLQKHGPKISHGPSCFLAVLAPWPKFAFREGLPISQSRYRPTPDTDPEGTADGAAMGLPMRLPMGLR
jgi:hypothetical protein